MKTKVDLIERYGIDLEGAVRKLTYQGNWTQLLDLSARFRSYSPLNLLLLFSQGCNRGFSPTLVAGYRGWQKLGRQVRKGEKALYIFAPSIRRVSQIGGDVPGDSAEEVLVGFRMVSVFDLCQTFGDNLTLPPEPQLLELDSSEISVFVQRLNFLLTLRGYRVEFEPLEAVNGFTDFENRLVKVRSDVSSAQCLKTLLHETAHVILHQERYVSRVQAELEAESCAYVVCRALGFDSSSYSFPYVARWSNGDLDLVSRVAQSVHSCAGEILDCLEVTDETGRRPSENLEDVCS
jgi:hypothetical protein